MRILQARTRSAVTGLWTRWQDLPPGKRPPRYRVNNQVKCLIVVYRDGSAVEYREKSDNG